MKINVKSILFGKRNRIFSFIRIFHSFASVIFKRNVSGSNLKQCPFLNRIHFTIFQCFLKVITKNRRHFP